MLQCSMQCEGGRDGWSSIAYDLLDGFADLRLREAF